MPEIPETPETPEITIYTDGGADPNPGAGGWAAILLDLASGKVRELSGGEPRATNNRMELTAAIRALEALTRPCQVRLYTDSQYLRKGITEWLPGWIARGWRRKDGELQNEDLWRRLSELIQEHTIRWDWVKGHASNRWNNRADELATLEIRKQRGSPGAGRAGRAGGGGRLPARLLRQGKGGWASLIRRGEEEEVLSGGFSVDHPQPARPAGRHRRPGEPAAGDLGRPPHRLGLPEERRHAAGSPAGSGAAGRPRRGSR